LLHSVVKSRQNRNCKTAWPYPPHPFQGRKGEKMEKREGGGEMRRKGKESGIERDGE